MNGIDEMIRYFNATPPGRTHHTIMATLLKNVHRIKSMSIEELAVICYTSPSTISRIVRSLGFKNYNNFKDNITEALLNYRLHNIAMPLPKDDGRRYFATYINTIHTLHASIEKKLDIECIMQITDALHDAAKVSIYCFHTNFTSYQLQYDLIMDNKETLIFNNRNDQLMDSK
jgi:DNA-binding MurR/RpiR family transcriptional regulator